MTHRVLIIDDHPLLRRGLSQLLALEPERELELIGETGDPAEGVRLAESLAPDLIILDLDMPKMNGAQTLQALREGGCEAAVVILTVSDRDEDIAETLKAGANGYLLKDMEPEQLLAALSRAANGEIVISPALTSTLCRAMQNHHPGSALSRSRITAREQEILSLLARGCSNKLIARALDITEGTAKVHVRNLLRKMKLRSRVEAAVWAVQNEIG